MHFDTKNTLKNNRNHTPKQYAMHKIYYSLNDYTALHINNNTGLFFLHFPLCCSLCCAGKKREKIV